MVKTIHLAPRTSKNKRMDRKLIILGRDGVINHQTDEGIKSAQEWTAIDGSLEAISRLCREDYRVVVVTNQSGIAKGLYSINALNQIHQKMIDELHHSGGEIDAIFFCPHHADDQCQCRKPAPGLLLELSKRLKCNLKNVCAVGDSVSDLQAACAAGATPVLVETGKGLYSVEKIAHNNYVETIAKVARFKDLSHFVEHLLCVAN